MVLQEVKLTLQELADKVFKENGVDVYEANISLVEEDEDSIDILGIDYADEFLETHGYKEVISYSYDEGRKTLNAKVKA